MKHRDYEISYEGETYTLRADFRASVEIHEKVGDPLMIAREAVIEHTFAEKGINYNPRWAFNVTNVVDLLEIGLKAADSSLKRPDIEDMVFDVGFGEAKMWASEYLSLIVGPAAEESITKPGTTSSSSSDAGK